jgi:rSAM/selenodomain-associated transferase 2
VISVVIPTLDEAATLGALLDDLAELRAIHEVIVVDGGSDDDTTGIARARGATVLIAPRGRGTQLRAGAALARAPLLCFLHADVRLPSAARERLARLATDGAEGAWAFRLRLDGRRWSFRLIEWGANARSSLLGLPYGDQGLVISRGRYDAAGGFVDVPLMEDVLLARALRRLGGIALLPEAVIASARRWERDGALRRSARNLWLLARFAAGASPAALAARYEPPRRG